MIQQELNCGEQDALHCRHMNGNSAKLSLVSSSHYWFSFELRKSFRKAVVEASPPPIGTTRGGHPNLRVKEIVDGERCSIADRTQCLGGDYGATNLRPFFPVKILEIFIEVRVYTAAEHSVISGTAYLDHDQD